MATNGKAPQTTRQVGNLSMPVLNISGNAYAPVHVRVEAAHAAGGYTMIRCEWKLIFEIKCCEVEIVFNEQHFIGTAEVKNGFAYSIEDMQTSALGRALGFAGFEIKTAIASADDMQAVLQAQGRTEIVESDPVALPEPNTLAGARNLATKLGYDYIGWKGIIKGYTRPDGSVDPEQVYRALEQELAEK